MRKNTNQFLADRTEKLMHEIGALQDLVPFGFQPQGRVFYAFVKDILSERPLAHLNSALLAGSEYLVDVLWLCWFEKAPRINFLLGRQTSPCTQQKSAQAYEANLNSKYRGRM